MKTLILIVLVLIGIIPIQAMATDCTIMLHGLARTSTSMNKMERYLERKGHYVINDTYPSRKHKIKKLANDALDASLKKCQPDQKINIVTHSMGAILFRQYIETHSIKNLQHVVMLAPPNQGSEIVDKLGNLPGYKLINGPAGVQLGTDETSLPLQLGPADYSLGIIAGNKTINFMLSTFLPDANDGKVSVEKTKLEGMNQHLVMPVTHPFMMRSNKVIRQVYYYLENGEFNAEM
ncbi:esterase/lipase family protein [Marinicellulosiphila megalodicopiae]|uniref:esterase/lipase family protein n=1 Tax=Marinicellulosiphila megalodicopiae TaxID=2724896 RepID=UPI003BB06E38